MSKKVYIAGPYTEGDWGTNVRRAIDAGNRVLEEGHVPFVPHTMTGIWSLVHQKGKEEWLDYDLEWLYECDAMIRLDGDSEGADIERDYADENDIPVYSSVDEFLREEGE